MYREEYHRAGHCHASADASEIERLHLNARLADLVEELHPMDDPRLVVELGAGWGALGAELAARGLPYLGLEPSIAMERAARERGLTMRRGGLETLELEPELAGRVRTFVAVSVYEHLPDQQGTLRRMRAMLPPDGRIVLQCPTAALPRLVGRWQRRIAPRRPLPSLYGVLAPPWHVCLPSIRGLRIQAARSGLEIVAVEVSPTGRH